MRGCTWPVHGLGGEGLLSPSPVIHLSYHCHLEYLKASSAPWRRALGTSGSPEGRVTLPSYGEAYVTPTLGGAGIEITLLWHEEQEVNFLEKFSGNYRGEKHLGKCGKKYSQEESYDGDLEFAECTE